MQIAQEQLVCSRCNASIPAEDWNREHAFCPVCRAPVSALVFPAFLSAPTPASTGTPLMEAGEASCFYHPQKRAVVPCDQCGRFLCGLCQVEFLGQNWCPRCIEAASQKGRLAQLDATRPLHDNRALMVAIFPIPAVWLTIFSAPLALYAVFRYWRAPSSILPRTKIRFIVAAVLASLQIAAWIWLALYIIYRR